MSDDSDDTSNDESASSSRKKPPPKKFGPKKWADYPPMGNVIEGTRFICFKAPLDRALANNPDHGKFTTDQLMQKLVPSLGRTLGMVVDLTDSYKFYSPYDAFESKQVKLYKIFCPGFAEVPKAMWVTDFNNTVTEFIKKTKGVPDINGEESLIGVHCMNGVNRTGYFVCQYMIKQLKMPPAKAMKLFDDARGCPIDSKPVRTALMKIGTAPPPKKKK